LAFIKQTLTTFGFKINNAKTKVMTKKNRHYVCGVVVNQKTNLIRHERKKLRAMVHNVSLYGLEPEAVKNSMTSGEFKNYLTGRLGWFNQLNPQGAEPLFDKLKDALNPEIVELPEF
jgi:ribosome-interacting GTPase 1